MSENAHKRILRLNSYKDIPSVDPSGWTISLGKLFRWIQDNAMWPRDYFEILKKATPNESCRERIKKLKALFEKGTPSWGILKKDSIREVAQDNQLVTSGKEWLNISPLPGKK